MSIYTEDLGRIARQDSEWAIDVVERTRRYESVVKSVLAKGQRDETLRSDIPVELALLSLCGMVNWMHRWYRPNLEFSASDIAHTFTEIFISGVGTEGAPPRSGRTIPAKKK
jgi:hypothetical protein